MKNLKKILSVLLVLSMMFALLCATGCSTFRDFNELLKNGSDEDSEGDSGNGNGDGGKDGSVGRNDFINGIGGVSETYKGSVSEFSYDTPQEAAEAYVAEEIVGENEVEILSSKSNGALSDSQISGLNLPEEVSEGMTGVEELEVEYSVIENAELESDGLTMLASDTLNKTFKVKVYVIKYETNWKYYTPAPITGKTITKSYYDSVFNYEKYKNCTYKTTMSIDITMSGTVEGTSINEKVKMSITQLVKHADNKVYLEQTTSSDDASYSNLLGTSMYAYLEENEYGDVVCYVKMSESGDWYETDLSTINFSSLEELTPFYDQYLDYTYFTKADFGFMLEKENAEKYVKQALSGFSSILGDDMNIDMFAEYYVSAGVLSGMRMDADLDFAMSMYGSTISAKEVIKSQMTCTDYGTTVVEKPFTE